MDLEAVFNGLATAAGTIDKLRAYGFAPDAVEEPCFFPVDFDIDYDQAFGRGMDAYMVRCRLLVSRSDDRAGNKNLFAYLKGAGPRSIKQALQADKTLGGACHALQLKRATGYGLYEHGNTNYFGVELEVLVIGRGD